MRKILPVLLIFISCKAAFGYVFSKTETGKDLSWSSREKQIPIYYDVTPSNYDFILDKTSEEISDLGLSRNQYIEKRIGEIFIESILEWNQVSPYQVLPIESEKLPAVGTGTPTFRFTDNYSYFGSGVIAVTSILYDADSGNISAADILMNQSMSNVIDLSLDKTVSSQKNAYLGDVLTHEMGHFLGLAHSEVIGSSMVFSIFKGQHTIHADDKAGILKNYGVITDLGSISGNIMAGDSRVPVFGVQVNLISLEDNQVVQSELSDVEGNFSFQNLDLNESYYIALSPVRNLSGLPDYYKNTNSDICIQQSFRTNMFSRCGPRDKSRPQVIHIDDWLKKVDVGEITIRCDENLDTEYYGNKFKDSERSYELLQNYNDMTAVFYGLFSSEEISEGIAGKGDEFTVDLRYMDLAGFTQTPSVKMNFTSTSIGSNFTFKIYTKLTSASTWTEHSYTYDKTNKLISNLSIKVPLSNTQSENLVEVVVYPVELTDDQTYEIFSAPKLLSNNNLYTISLEVGEVYASGFYAAAKADSYPYDDNTSCAEGNVTYTSNPYTPLSTNVDALQLENPNDQVVSCATIDLDGGPGSGNGPGNFLLGVFIVLLMFISSKFGHISLSDS